MWLYLVQHGHAKTEEEDPERPPTSPSANTAKGRSCTGETASASTGARRTGGCVPSAKRAGLGPVHPHMLRAAFIMAALDAGVPLRDIQIAARHADPRTTTISLPSESSRSPWWACRSSRWGDTNPKSTRPLGGLARCRVTIVRRATTELPFCEEGPGVNGSWSRPAQRGGPPTRTSTSATDVSQSAPDGDQQRSISGLLRASYTSVPR